MAAGAALLALAIEGMSPARCARARLKREGPASGHACERNRACVRTELVRLVQEARDDGQHGACRTRSPLASRTPERGKCQGQAQDRARTREARRGGAGDLVRRGHGGTRHCRGSARGASARQATGRSVWAHGEASTPRSSPHTCGCQRACLGWRGDVRVGEDARAGRSPRALAAHPSSALHSGWLGIGPLALRRTRGQASGCAATYCG